MASGVGAVVVEHDHGCSALGVDVMNGHLNDDAILTETDSANSNWGCPRPKASCYAAALPPMKGTAVLTTITASVVEVSILPGRRSRLNADGGFRTRQREASRAG